MIDIPYIIKRNKRRTRLTISVTPEGVVVKAPIDSPEKQIHSFVNKHKEWIKIKQAEMNKVVSEKKSLTFADGEKIPFLDNSYTLRINENSSYRLQRRNDELHIDIPANLSNDQKRRYIIQILKKWYKRLNITALRWV
ncbi:MAG: YgjP-like metallopeptidase domain-containing protein [Armatimonadota bacterium]